MAKNNGHWYTDKNGNHYFVENGQSPKEGWEESKRRKMISGGKYMTSEDGNDYSEVDKDKYDAYEADEADFDENVDDDFGFDEEEDNYTSTIDEMRQDGVNVDDPREVMQYLGANMGLDREDQVSFMERLGYSVNDIEKLRNPGDDFEDDDSDFEWTEAEERQIDKYAEHYGADANAMKKSIYAKAQEYMKGDNMGDEEAYDKAMEEVLDEVANGEYNREMKKAQEQNAAMSERDMERFLDGSQGVKPQFSREQRYATYTAEDEVGLTDYKYKTKEDVDKVAKWLVDNHYAKDNSEAVELIKSEMRDPSEIDRALENAAQGGSQNYNYEDEGHYNNDGSWKPGNHRTGQWAPEYFGVYEKRSPDGIGYTEKEYRGDFPSLEKAQEFASKYQGKNPLNIGKFQLQSNGSYRNVENQEYKRPTKTQSSLPRYAIDRFKSGDYDSNTAIEEILKAFPDARSALNWMLSEFKRK